VSSRISAPLRRRDTRDYERLLREKLYKIPGIRHSQSHFVLRVLKEASVPLG
jgi:Lrp/AsnC family leucine-responsive transcriptional regulator